MSTVNILTKIAELEKEIARTQKNKATNAHLCLQRAKLAKYRSQLINMDAKSGGTGEGFDVLKSGNARVAMIGFPSVGKSSLLSKLTKTESTAAAYQFTTLTCIPGVIDYKDAKIQLLDLPGIIEGAAKGKGRGKQVIGVARTSDVILMVLDASKADIQRVLLTKELEAVGIRINQAKPNVTFKRKATGGIRINSTVELTYIDDRLIRQILQLHRIRNCDLLFRENVTSDQLIDIIEGNRVYMRCLYCVNKVDLIDLYQVDRFAHQPDTVVCSITHNLNLDYLLDKIWEYLDFIRVYTKPRGSRPSLHEPLILRNGTRVEHVCHGIHRDFIAKFKYALVWGTSAKHQPQQVGHQHELHDEDVVQLMTR